MRALRWIAASLLFFPVALGCTTLMSTEDDGEPPVAQVADPPGDVAEGSIDVTAAGGAHEVDAAGTTTVGVGVCTAEAYPPPQEPNSRYCECTCRDGSSTVRIVDQQHQGTTEVIVSGPATNGQVVPLPSGNGIVCTFDAPAGWNIDTTECSIETGWQETPGATILHDTSDAIDVGSTTPVEDVVQEIDAVLVPC